MNCQLPAYVGGKVVWEAREIAADFPVAFMPVDDGGSGGLSQVGQIVADLEMYGGAGIGSNAGGVRCGNFAGLQIKGIGPSVLAGPGADKWHRHGALSLQDAVRETVVGELLAMAAPSGAVRALGIVDLGFDFQTEVGKEKAPGSAPRALLYREQSVRLAHFMRSSFMNVGYKLAQLELARMRDGLPRFVDWLCGKSPRVDFELAAQGVRAMFELILNQLATLRTKRLVHGSLIPSNLCIDGRLVDFTTTTAVSTLHPVLVSVGGWSSQHQHHQALLALPDLLFYISKFDKRCAVTREKLEQTCQNLKSELTLFHDRTLMREHLGLLGFPVDRAAQLDESTQNALLASLIAVIQSGSVEGHVYFGGDEHAMLLQNGRNDILAVIAEAICEATGLSLPVVESYHPEPEAFPTGVRMQLKRAFADAAVGMGSDGLNPLEQGMAWLIRAVQRNADLTPLYRRQLDGDINDICLLARSNIGVFIDRILARWSGVFHTPSDGRVSLKGWLTEQDVWLSAKGRLEVGGEALSPLELRQLKPAEGVRPRHQWLFDVANRQHRQ